MRDHDVLPFLELVLEGAPLPGKLGHPLRLFGGRGLGRLRGDLVGFWGARFGGAQRLDRLIGVAAAQFGVGGHSNAPGPGGDLLPGPPVVHRLRQPGLDPPAHLLKCLGGRSHPGVPLRGVRVGGGPGFGLGADGLLAGVLRAEPDAAQLPADVRRCPLGFGLVAVAHVPQRGLRQRAHVNGVGAGERGEPGVPGGALLGRAARRLRTERIGLVSGAV